MNRPFRRLVAHFASVIIQSGQDEGGSDLNLGIGGVLALLAVPGAFVSLGLFDKYSSLLLFLRGTKAFDAYRASLPDKYFFIVLSMAITGVVTALKWDRIFPSRQDYLNLAALPIRPRTIFSANLAALLLLAGLFAIDVNAASTLIFPMVVPAAKGSLGEYFAFMGVHAAIVLAASLFTFFACFGLVGALLALLPGAVFRRVSMFFRLILIVALMGLLFTSFAIPPLILRLPKNPDSWVRFLPPVWFTALYQSIQDRANPTLTELARTALRALTISAGLAISFLLLSYRRYFLKIPESTGNSVARQGTPGRLLGTLLDRWLLRSPFQRACYRFAWRVLTRSEMHGIALGAFAGLGLITASQAILSVPAARGQVLETSRVPGVGVLAAPLCIAFFLITGMRFAFELPAGLTANWVYRLILDRGKHQAPAVARKLIWSLLAMGLLLPAACIFVVVWGWPTGILEMVWLVSMCLLLVEGILLNYRKIPFTCATPGFENHAIVWIVAYGVAFFVFTSWGAAVERWMLLWPVRFWGLPVAAVAAWYGLHSLREDAEDGESRLVYENEAGLAVQTLDLRVG